MFASVRNSKPARLAVGLLAGVVLGLLLHKGGLTYYEIIVAQFLLSDFTAARVVLSAVVVGMVGLYAMYDLDWIRLRPSPGSVTTNVIGGVILGVGFALLGYGPALVMGAAGRGGLDALLGGVPGILLGAGLFAAALPWLKSRVLDSRRFSDRTLHRLFGVSHWLVILPLCALIVALLVWIEATT